MTAERVRQAQAQARTRTRARARARARAQALADGVREVSAGAVVRRVFAVQAQDAVAADLGIRARGQDLSAEAIRTAYEEDRSIVRSWFMRGTLHTIPSDDVRWVLRLLAPRILAATSRRYHQLGLDDARRERADRLIRRALSVHGPLTRPQLTEHLAAAGLQPDGQAAFHLIRHAALTGVLCHGPRLREETSGETSGETSEEATYVLLDDWLPAADSQSLREQDAAAAELARRYRLAHAPVEADDFAAWSGLPVTQARRAWKTLPDRLTDPSDRPGPPDVRMLPAYDNYLVGYRTREFSVPAAHQRRVWLGGGVIRPTVICDGLAIGTWTRREAGRVIQVDPFEPLPSPVQADVEAEADAVTRFLHPPA